MGEKKDSTIKQYLLCLVNISKNFTAINMKKQDSMDTSTNFLLIAILLILVILLIFINI